MDLFYYGTQDVPVPLRRVRPPTPRSRSFLCESCREAVTPEDLARGIASEVFGLVVCGRCRVNHRGEDRVQLYFCSHCGISVPVFSVETGEALQGDGLLLCVPCRAARRHPRLRRLPIAIAALLVVAMFVLRPSPSDRVPGPDVRRLAEDIVASDLAGSDAAEKLGALEGLIAEISSSADRIAGGRDGALDLVDRANADGITERIVLAERLESLCAAWRELAERALTLAGGLDGEGNPLNPRDGGIR